MRPLPPPPLTITKSTATTNFSHYLRLSLYPPAFPQPPTTTTISRLIHSLPPRHACLYTAEAQRDCDPSRSDGPNPTAHPTDPNNKTGGSWVNFLSSKNYRVGSNPTMTLPWTALDATVSH